MREVTRRDHPSAPPIRAALWTDGSLEAQQLEVNWTRRWLQALTGRLRAHRRTCWAGPEAFGHIVRPPQLLPTLKRHTSPYFVAAKLPLGREHRHLEEARPSTRPGRQTARPGRIGGWSPPFRPGEAMSEAALQARGVAAVAGRFRQQALCALNLARPVAVRDADLADQHLVRLHPVDHQLAMGRLVVAGDLAAGGD
jgi:hypothetical protein